MAGSRSSSCYLWLVALGALALATSGCTDKQAEIDANARRLAASAQGDATQPIEDEGFRFKLSLPAPGYKLMREAEAASLSPGARAGAISPDGVVGLVIVDPDTGGSLADQARATVGRLRLSERVVELDEQTDRGGAPAHRFVVSGKARGLSLRYAGFVQRQRGWTYRVIAWASAAQVDDSARAFDLFFAAFELSDGGMEPHVATTPVSDASGVGHRIVDGVFESADSCLRVKPGDGWRLLTGAELRAENREAEIGLQRVAPNVTVLLFAEPLAGESTGVVDAMESEVRRRLAGGKDAERVGFTLLDKKLGAQRITPTAGGLNENLEFMHTAYAQSGRAYQMLAHYPVGDSRAVQALLRPSMAGVGLLSEAACRELADTLDQLPPAQSYVGAEEVVREGRFRNFDRGLTWVAPAPSWRLFAGDQARSVNPDALLYLENRRFGLFGLVIAEQAGRLDDKSYHQRVRDGLSARVDLEAPPAEPTTFATLPALVSEGNARLRSTTLRYRVTTAVRGDLALQMLAWARPAIAEARRKEMQAMIDAFSLDETQRPVERSTDAYVDHRLGFEMRLPANWSLEDRTPAELSPIGTFLRWEHRGRWIGVLAVALDEDRQDDDFVVSLMEQLLRDQIASLSRATPNDGPFTLAGKPARRLAWHATLHHIDALILRAGGVGYALVVVDRDDRGMDEVAKSFGLVSEPR